MAAGTKCKLRSFGPPNIRTKCTTIYSELRELKEGYHRTLRLFELIYEGVFSNGFTEISAPNAVFDGTTTPVAVKIVSTDAKDAGDGVGARVVVLMGIASTGLYCEEALTLTGTEAVTSVTLWKRLIHAYCFSWGSEGDPAGTITITNLAGNTIYLTIAAGAQDSDGARLWFPVDWNVMIHRVVLSPLTQLAATRSIGVKFLRHKFDKQSGAGNEDSLAYQFIKVSGEGTTAIIAGLHDVYVADADANLQLFETYLGGEMTGTLRTIIAMYDPNDPLYVLPESDENE